MTAWTDQRDQWVRQAKRRELLAVIEVVAADYELDEHAGDWTERAETILWLASRGAKGKDWGHAADPAVAVGGWEDPDALATLMTE